MATLLSFVVNELNELDMKRKEKKNYKQVFRVRVNLFIKTILKFLSAELVKSQYYYYISRMYKINES